MDGIMRFGLKVLEYVKRAKRGEAGVANELKQSYATWAELSEGAYGVDFRIPKFHFSQHLWEQLEMDGFIVDCFATERANSMWLKAANLIANTREYEKSVALRALNLHLGKLHTLRRVGLVAEKPCTALAANAYVSDGMQWQGSMLYVADMILLDDSEVLKILACARVGEELAIVASVLEKRERLSSGSCVYETHVIGAQVVFLSGRRIRLPNAWHYKENSLVVIVE